MTAPVPMIAPIELAAEAPADADFAEAMERAVAERIGGQRFQLWFQGHTRFALAGDHLIVRVANLHYQDWLSKQFTVAIRAAAAEVLDRPVSVRFRIDPELFQANRAAQEQVARAATEPPRGPHLNADRLEKETKSSARSAPIPSAKPVNRPATPGLFDHVDGTRSNGRSVNAHRRRWRHLNEFVVGPCNRVAFASAASLVDEPGHGPNPLLLHGPVGTGKTHLLEGVFAGLKRRDATLRVVFITAEDFTNRFVASMRFGKQSAFRRHFRSCDVLLLDDLHFLAKKRATQEEFLHTLDALLDDGRQVMLACDCHPRLNDDFVPELRDRLLGGASWGLQPPDGETRLAILRAKAAGRAKDHGPRTEIPDDVLRFLAENLRGNVRELEGALNCVRHFGRVANHRVDITLAREALGELLRHAVRVVQVADVDAAVCAVLSLSASALQAKERSWSVSHPRMLATYLCRKHTAASYSEISKHFGGHTHSTAVAAEKKVRQWLQDGQTIVAAGREWSIRDLIERIERELLK